MKLCTTFLHLPQLAADFTSVTRTFAECTFVQRKEANPYHYLARPQISFGWHQACKIKAELYMEVTLRNKMILLALAVCASTPVSFAQQESDTANFAANLAANKKILINERAFLHIHSLMRKAAYNHASALGAQKSIAAREDQKTAVLLNSISLNGSLSKSHADNTLDYEQKTGSKVSYNGPDTIDINQASLSAKLFLSLSLFFQARGIELNQATEKAALNALEMQLATESAKAYIEFVINTARTQRTECYIDTFRETLKKYQAAGRELDPATKSLVDTQLDQMRSVLSRVRFQRDTAKFDLEKFIPADEVEDLRKSIPMDGACDTEHLSIPSVGFDITKAEKLFPLPQSPALAYEDAQQSPSVIQANLAEKHAQNQWYLTLASAGPFVAFTFSEFRSKTKIDDLPVVINNKEQNGQSYLFQVGFSIGGGLFNSLHANDLLEQASRYNKQAVELQLRDNIEKDYRSIEYFQEELSNNMKIMLDAAPGIQDFPHNDVKALRTFITTFRTYFRASGDFADFFSKYLNMRVQTLGASGKLLDVIEAKKVETK